MKNKIEKIMESARKNSIGKDKKNKLVKNSKKITSATLATLMILSTSVCLCSCDKVESNIDNKSYMETVISDDYYAVYKQGSLYSTFLVSDAKQKLKDYNIEYYNDKTGYIKNEVSDYKKINTLCEDDMFGFYKLLGKEESEKIIKVLGYKNWDDYLIKNNFLDKNGNPSITVWEYDIYKELMEKYDEGEKTK